MFAVDVLLNIILFWGRELWEEVINQTIHGITISCVHK